MAIAERPEDTAAQSPTATQLSASQNSQVQLGFAFLDAAAGRIYVGTATDDAARANLGAVLTQVRTAGPQL